MKLVHNKNLILLLLTIIIIVFSIYQNPVEKEPIQSLDQVKNETISILEDLGKKKYLVNNWTLRYYHTNYSTPKPWYDYGPFSAIFECPEDDMIIEFNGKQVIPTGSEFEFPLTLYSGNTYNDTVPAFWSGNVTCSDNVRILLVDAGWYTVTLTGDAHRHGHRFSLHSWGEERFETVLVFVSFQVKRSDGAVSVFKVNNRMWEPS